MVAVLNREDARSRALAPALLVRRVWFGERSGYHTDGTSLLWGEERLIDAETLQLRGRHNLLNACAALTALEQSGVEVRPLVSALSEFRPLRHRLEPVGDVGGVSFVNDSIATIPEATVAALDALEGRPVVLLAGGFDRGQDYAPLARRLSRARGVLAVVAMPPSGIRLAQEVTALGDAPPVLPAADLAEAVRLASKHAEPGSVMLLSPGAPSYGAFRDFEARGDAFRALVADLASAPP